MRILNFMALLSGIVLCAACSNKISNKASLNRPPIQLRVMSYNVHHCNPPSKPGLIDVDAIAKTIIGQHPDLVALQEIDVNTIRSGRIDEAALLAEKTGMKVYFAKAIDHDGGYYGVAILSKYPISQMKTYRLPTEISTKGEPRVLATASISLPNGKTILFANTHLDAQKGSVNRMQQIVEINRLKDLQTMPLILAGDLNARPGSAEINLLETRFTRTCVDCAFTIPVINPTSAIDHIAFPRNSSFKIISHEVIPERYASDHLPVLAIIETNP